VLGRWEVYALSAVVRLRRSTALVSVLLYVRPSVRPPRCCCRPSLMSGPTVCSGGAAFLSQPKRP